jgi:hypothetical protein
MSLFVTCLYSLSCGENLQGKVIGLPLRRNHEVFRVLISRFLSLPVEGTSLSTEGTDSLTLTLTLTLALAFSEPKALSHADFLSGLKSLGEASHEAALASDHGSAVSRLHTRHVFASDAQTRIGFDFGPVGALGAVFVQGKDAVIPEGAEFYVAVGSDVRVHGMTLPVDTVVEITKDMPLVEIKPGK